MPAPFASLVAVGLLGGASLPARPLQPARIARPHIRSVAPAPEKPEVETAAAERMASKQGDRLNIRIDDEWYDLTNWRAAHPAGTHWIDAYKNQDATEVRQPATRRRSP